MNEHDWAQYARAGIAYRDAMAGVERAVRAAPEVRASDDDDSGDERTLFGHAAVTGQWTDLEDFVGPYREQIAPGAFTKTLKERGGPVVMFNHGRDPGTGQKPLGETLVAREDDTGLYIEARLFDTHYVRELLPALESGTIDGMSFMFDIISELWTWASDSKSGMDERTIQEVRLYEAGPVVFPAYEQTDVGIRTHVDPALVEQLTIQERRILSHLCRTSPPLVARLGQRAVADAAATPPPQRRPEPIANSARYGALT